MARFHEPAFNASDMGDTDDDLRHEHEIESENLADQLEEQQADEAVGAAMLHLPRRPTSSWSRLQDQHSASQRPLASRTMPFHAAA